MIRGKLKDGLFWFSVVAYFAVLAQFIYDHDLVMGIWMILLCQIVSHLSLGDQISRLERKLHAAVDPATKG